LMMKQRKQHAPRPCVDVERERAKIEQAGNVKKTTQRGQ